MKSIQRIEDLADDATEAFDEEEPRLLRTTWEHLRDGDDEAAQAHPLAYAVLCAWDEEAGHTSDRSTRRLLAITATRHMISQLELILAALEDTA